MKIVFKNGSMLKTIPSVSEPVRSKRGNKQFTYWSDYWQRHPEVFIEEFMGVKLSCWQKIMVQFYCAKIDLQEKIKKMLWRNL